MKRSIMICLMVLCFSPVLMAGISLDHVEGEWSPGFLSTYENIVFHLRYTNTYGANISGMTNGFRIYSPDGATWDPVVIDTTNLGWPFIFDLVIQLKDVSVTGSGADTVGFGTLVLVEQGLPTGFDEIALTISTRIDPSQIGKTICVDSSWYPNSGRWLWSSPGQTYFPSWDGPHCFTIDPGYVCGNINDDFLDVVDISDLFYLVGYLFQGGQAPTDMRTADVDGSSGVNINDLMYLINYLFKGGPAPCTNFKKSPTIVNEGNIEVDLVTGLHMSTDVIKAGEPVSIYLRMQNTGTGNYGGITNGFRIFSPDGAQWDPLSLTFSNDGVPASQIDYFYIREISKTGSGADTVGFGGYTTTLSGLTSGYNEVAYRIDLGVIDPQYGGKNICIDSCWYPPANEWMWGNGVTPAVQSWGGPYCFTIEAVSGLETKFTSDITAGVVPLTVNFTDQSVGSPESYLWDFGDNTTSTATNPSHTYTEVGQYTVSLTTTKTIPGGSDIDTVKTVKLGYISVGEQLEVDLAVEATIHPWSFRSGHELVYWCYWNNGGNTAADLCTLHIELPWQMAFLGLRDQDGNEISASNYERSGQTITVPLGSVAASNDWLYVSPHGDLVGGSPGENMRLKMWITTSSTDIDPSNDTTVHNISIPISGKKMLIAGENTADKYASPNGNNSYYKIPNTQRLSYSIEFANAPDADKNISYLEIVDTLDTDLDWSDGSLQEGPMSHGDCIYLGLDPETGEISWWCDNINLTPGEEGFFTYSINPKNDLVDGTQIANLAKLRFDHSGWVSAPGEGPVIREIGVNTCCIPPLRGDVNYLDDGIDIGDLVYFVEYQFNLPPGPEPPCFDEADVDASGGLDIADIVWLVEYQFDIPPGPAPFDCP